MLLLLFALAFPSLVSALEVCKAIDPPPKELICGKAGSLTKPLILNELDGKPLIIDYDTCVRVASLPLALGGIPPATFSWDSSNSHCLIYDTPLRHEGFTPNNKSTVKFWNKNCFSCNEVCPETIPSENVLLNGGFEYSNHSIYPFGDFPTGFITHPGFNSPNAFQCHYSQGENDCFVQTFFDVCSDSNYGFTFDYKVDAGPEDDSVITFGIGSQSIILGPFEPADLGVWKSISTSFYPDVEFTGTRNGFSATLESTTKKAVLTIDNLLAQAVKFPIPVKAGAKNLVRNGNFETGKLAPWTKGGAANQTKIVSPGYNGSKYAVSITPDKVDTTDEAYITQNIEVVPGIDYVLKFHYINTTHHDVATTTTPQVNDSVVSYAWDLFTPPQKMNGYYVFNAIFRPVEKVVTVHMEMEEGGILDDVTVMEAA